MVGCKHITCKHDELIFQPHLDKCFGNIKSLDIKTLPHQPPTVKTMISSEGEVIVMPKYVFSCVDVK